jgi:hypothetical protein
VTVVLIFFQLPLPRRWKIDALVHHVDITFRSFGLDSPILARMHLSAMPSVSMMIFF